MQEINNQYIKLIQPIFQGKCFDCHSQFTQYPWYYRLPGVRRLIDHDIAEARKHLDMSNGFPFQGHGSIESDLEAIETTIKERKMPPIRFKVLHWNSSLTEEEIRQVARWISEARRKLDIGRSAELSIQEK